MAPRKNTAQAYEVLFRMAKEEESKRKAASPPVDAEKPGVSPTESLKPIPSPPRLERQPLLGRTTEPETKGRRASAKSRFARGRAGRVAGPPRDAPAERPLESPSTPVGREPLSRPTVHHPPRASSPEPSRRAEQIAAQERALLLEDDIVTGWGEPFLPGSLDPSSPQASSVDPALTRRGGPDDWPEERRLRFLEPREPSASRHLPEDVPTTISSSSSSQRPHPTAGRSPGEALEIGPRAMESRAPELPVPVPGTESVSGGAIASAASSSLGAPSVVRSPDVLLAPDPGRLPAAENETGDRSVRLQGIWHGLRRGATWVAGEGSTRWLERRVELKLATLLVATIAGVIVTTLVLMFIRRPGEEDALFRSGFEGSRFGLNSSSPEPASLASAPVTLSAEKSPEAPLEAVEPGVAHSTTPRGDGVRPTSPQVRRFPLWGPGMGVSGENGTTDKAPEPYPEVRNVVVKPATPSPEDAAADRKAAAAPEPVTAPEAATEPEAIARAGLARQGGGRSGAYYVIQVRAKESMKGAQGIVDYLSLFGFDDPLIARDPREDRNAYGEELHTVFVGRYADRGEADRECARLKRETRARPYKSRAAFFSDCLVITRAQ